MNQSIPIKISTSTSNNNLLYEYSLKPDNVNPFKESPPTSWKSRLGERYMSHFKEANKEKRISMENCKI
jgi:hypothetical protein